MTAIRNRLRILLKGQIVIGGDEYIKLAGCQGEQLAIFDRRPSHLMRTSDVMADEGARQPPVDTLVKQNSHETDSTSLFFASSRKAMTFPRVTEGKPSRN
jgi:hypothetical protein